MTEETLDLQKALRMLETAEASLKTARQILENLSPESIPKKDHPTDLHSYEEADNQIVEGFFDGQNMIGPNERIFPIPANYVSKSKLVEGDKLKLTILPNGTFLYKQIEPVDRAILKGTLIKEDGQYRVTTDEGVYKVILASVTYYKGKVGDEVTIVVPENKNSQWAAIEAIIPQMQTTEVKDEDTF
ncbi:hypothetical protein KKC94_03300 [Patescibacteria group bacterium]|nr:hypothetical protein [Patescibacteria group bacterium]